MNELIGRVFSFEKTIFPNQSALFGQLIRDGQSVGLRPALAS